MGGFNINLPGLNFNLTPEVIDAARRVQGLPPLNAAPAPVAPPVAAPAPPPPVAAPAPVPDVQPSIGQGVGSFLLNERFGQNIPVEPRIPAQPAPVAAPPPPPVAAAPPPPPAPPPQAMPQPRDMLGSMALSAPSERFEPVQADLPVQPAPQPAPVVAPPPPPPVVEPPPPVIDSEGIPAVITPPPVIAPPPPPPPPVVEPPPPPEPSPAVAMRDRLGDSALNQFLGLDERRPMSSETRWGQPVPAQRPRVTPTPPESTPPAVDEGIASLTRDAIAGTQYPGLEGFDPANPLNPIAAPAPDPVFQGPASGSQVMDSPTVDFSSMNPPSGWQGGGGEYNPSNGITDEDRLALGAWDQARQDFRRSQQPVAGPEPPPPPPVVEPPPVEEEYVEVVVPEPAPPPPVVPPFEPEPAPPPAPAPAPVEEIFTPEPVVSPAPDAGERSPGTGVVPRQPSEPAPEIVLPQPVTEPPPEVAPAPLPSEPAPAPTPMPEPEPAEPIEIEPEQPLPRYRYTPYVPQQFNYILPDVARSFAPFGAFQPRPFTGGVPDSELDVGYGDVTAPELSLPPATYQPIPSFQVAQPEYVQIEGPSAPVVDPFATPIQPEFAPLPSYERATYSPQTQKMVDQILSEEEMANPFMNPYLRSGVFGGR